MKLLFTALVISLFSFSFVNDERGAQPLDLIFVEGGSFAMGCFDPRIPCDDDESELRDVTVYAFYISTTEITQGLWEDIMGNNISIVREPSLPANNISWYDAVKFCNNLSLKYNLNPCYTIRGQKVTCNFKANGYRLPTEAEWEYAARGGKSGKMKLFSGNDDPLQVGWYRENSNGKMRPPKQKSPNELGIFDMSGNLWEWCWDWYAPYSGEQVIDPKGPDKGTGKVLRGGSWNYDSKSARNSNRFYTSPNSRSATFGFRVVKKVG